MNAPTAPADFEAPRIELLPLESIVPSPTHVQQLRRKRYDMTNLADLRDSIAKHGVQQPIVVRSLLGGSTPLKYEIVFGERRWRAARQAGLDRVPAQVRILSDVDTLELQLVENLQREDLHPLEEAAGYKELLQASGGKPEDLVAKIGKSRSWIYSRLNLLALPAEIQEALQDGRLDVSRALVVAGIVQPHQRAEAFAMAIARNPSNNFELSVRQLRARILEQRLTFPLHGAPFPREDEALLPAAGPCAACPKRSGNSDPEAPDPDVCTDAACYRLKVKAWAARRREEAIAAGAKVLRGEEARKLSPSVKTVYGHVDLDLVCEFDHFPEPQPTDVYADDSVNPSVIAYQERKQAWQPRTYRELLEGQKYESVLIDDPKTKDLRELVPFKQAQQLLKKAGVELPNYANRKRPAQGRGAGGGESFAEQSKRHEAERAMERARAELETEARRRILKATFPKIKPSLTRTALQGIVKFQRIAGETFELLFGHSALDKLSEADLCRLLIAGREIDEIEQHWGQPTALMALAGALKVDVAGIRKQVAAEAKAKEEQGEKKPAAKAKGKKK